MKISVIIPVYNHAHTLPQVFDSLLTQTHKDLEVIVVNDGSTDNFSETIKEILLNSKYSSLNIQVVEQENSGAPAARNHGFTKSTGQFVIFWDADTVAEPSMLEKMLSVLKDNPEASYVYSGFKFGFKKFKSQKFDAEKLKKMNYIDVTSLIRREDFPGFDENLKKFQDWDLWLNLLFKNKTGIYLPEILYKKIIAKKEGISSWLPSFFYKLPFKNKAVKKYEEGREIIYDKHKIEF